MSHVDKHVISGVEEEEIDEANTRLSALGGFVRLVAALQVDGHPLQDLRSTCWTTSLLPIPITSSHSALLTAVRPLQNLASSLSLACLFLTLRTPQQPGAGRCAFWSDCFRISALVLGSEVRPEASYFEDHSLNTLQERAVLFREVQSPVCSSHVQQGRAQ